MPSCLVVDDSRVVRAVARRIFEGMSFSVAEAENGREALERCGDGMPDVILLDWNMPVMDGIDFLRTLRARPDGLGPTVIFCTTEREAGRISQAIEAGADEYIMKPFDSDIVHSKLEQAGAI